MAFIVDNDYYQYAALVAATSFLVPQLHLGYKSGSLKDISISSQITVICSSALWAFYMYESELWYYACATSFVGICSMILLMMKVSFYYKRVNEHYKSFDKPPTLSISSCPSDNNV